jgi:AcrR family transcriptional regulator
MPKDEPSGTAPRSRRPEAEQRRRLPPDRRERIIAEAAVSFFAEHGFGGQTRELARRIGITQSLLYRYFPSKDALIERVYQEVFVGRWNQQWETWLDDRGLPLEERLLRFYRDYAQMILSYEWVRLFFFAGLRGLDFNARFLKMLRDRIFTRVIGELRAAHRLPPTSQVPMQETEVELVWALHAAIFDIGTRRWIYGLAVPDDIDALVASQVTAFLAGAPATIARRLEEVR